MSILNPDAAPAADTPADTPDANAAPVDPMADAAERLFDGKPSETPEQIAARQQADQAKPNGDPKPEDKPAERNPALPPENETAEEKAAREAAETPEQKAAREAAEAEEAEKAKAKDEKDERYGAPEGDADYEAFTMPEGVTLDETGAKDLGALAKELNLSQASAQKIVDLAVAKAQRDAETGAAQLETVREGWRTATKSDKEFGGDKLDASLVTAQKALKQFGSPELNELVVGAGLGDHPEFIRLMVRVGNAISEAPIVNGGQPAAKDAASVLYPNLPRK